MEQGGGSQPQMEDKFGLNQDSPARAQKGDQEWVLNTCASEHRTSNQYLLHDKEKFLNNSLFIEMERFRIPYVSYNPEAGTKNVLSVSQLAEDHDMEVVFEPTCCYVRDSTTGKVVGRGRVLNGTYVLDSLLIGQAQDVVDAILPSISMGTQELKGNSNSRFYRAKKAFLASPHHAVFNTETFIIDSAVAFNYTDSHGVNLVSVSQLTKDCSVRVAICKEGFCIEKLQNMEWIGYGYHYSGRYKIACLDVGAASDWVLDTVARCHHTPNRQLLYDVHEKAEDLLQVGEHNDQVQIHGSVRSVRFMVPGVRYIASSSARNTISVDQLAKDRGLVTVFEARCCYVKDRKTERIVGKGRRLRNGTYVLDYLLIHMTPIQDVVDASPSRAMSREELQGGISELNLEYPERGSWFGMSRSDRSIRDPTVDVFHMSSPHDEQQRGTRTKEFYMDSGALHHMTWNGDVLKAYLPDLNMETPSLQSATCVISELSRPPAVGGIGYIDSIGGSLDCVLFVPDSSVNLVSVSQLTEDHSARVVFCQQEFWVEKLESNETIGHGQWDGTNYVVAVFDVGAASKWILDTFAPLHHTADRRVLRSIEENVGSVQTKRYNIPNVHYMPTNKRNVISVAQLAKDHGLVTVLEPKCCHVKVKETGQIVARGCLCNGVYTLDYLIINIYQSITQVQDGGSHGGAQGGGDRSSGGSYGGHGDGAQGGQDGGQGDGKQGSGGQDGGDNGDEEEEEGEEAEEEEEEEEEDEDEELEEVEGGPPSNLFGEMQDYMDIDGDAPSNPLPDEAFQELTNAPGTNEFFFCTATPSYHVTWNPEILFRYPLRLHESTMPPIASFDGVAGSDNNGVAPIEVTDAGYLNGNNVILDAVLLAPNSQMNIVSVNQLTQQYWVTLEFDNDGIKIIKNSNNGQNVECGRGFMNGSSRYVLERFHPIPLVLYANSPEDNYHFYEENFYGPVPQ